MRTVVYEGWTYYLSLLFSMLLDQRANAWETFLDLY